MMDNRDKKEMRITRTFSAPAVLLWKVWTDPEHIAHWWGPNGHTTIIHSMDFKEGGEWKLTMTGPDGTDYPNRSVFKEIVPNKKIVFEHFNPHFIATIIFESNGEETTKDWSMLFDTEEMRQVVVKTYKADEGQKQNVDKLERYLSQMINKTKR